MKKPLALAAAAAAAVISLSPAPATALDCSWCEHVYDNCVRSGLVVACAAQYVECQKTNCSLGDLNGMSTTTMSTGGFTIQRR